MAFLMKAQRKTYLLGLLEKEIAAKSRQVEEAKKFTRSIAEHATSSWSIAGEREHAEQAQEIAKGALENLLKLQKEVMASNEGDYDVVALPCYLVVSYGGPMGKRTEFFLVNTNAKLPGLQLVTPFSPLGKAVVNKKAGQKFSFQIGEEKVSGIIESLE